MFATKVLNSMEGLWLCMLPFGLVVIVLCTLPSWRSVGLTRVLLVEARTSALGLVDHCLVSEYQPSFPFADRVMC